MHRVEEQDGSTRKHVQLVVRVDKTVEFYARNRKTREKKKTARDTEEQALKW